MQVNESSENYLETILVLSKRNPVVRSVDIAEELGFKKSSVSVAMKNLREKNNITVTKEGYIYLTDSGREIAEMIYERHELLTDWLTRLGVDPKIAAEDACRMEHVISKEKLMRSKNILNNLIYIHLYISTIIFTKTNNPVHILNRSVITKTRVLTGTDFRKHLLFFYLYCLRNCTGVISYAFLNRRLKCSTFSYPTLAAIDSTV